MDYFDCVTVSLHILYTTSKGLRARKSISGRRISRSKGFFPRVKLESASKTGWDSARSSGHNC